MTLCVIYSWFMHVLLYIFSQNFIALSLWKPAWIKIPENGFKISVKSATKFTYFTWCDKKSEIVLNSVINFITQANISNILKRCFYFNIYYCLFFICFLVFLRNFKKRLNFLKIKSRLAAAYKIMYRKAQDVKRALHSPIGMAISCFTISSRIYFGSEIRQEDINLGVLSAPSGFNYIKIV